VFVDVDDLEMDYAVGSERCEGVVYRAVYRKVIVNVVAGSVALVVASAVRVVIVDTRGMVEDVERLVMETCNSVEMK